MSSLASLTADIDSTKTKGTAVVNHDKEEICGINCGHTHTHTYTILVQ